MVVKYRERFVYPPQNDSPGKQARPLYEVAAEIRGDWKKVYFGAVPYLEAMGSLNSIKDNFYYDSGSSVVLYFLANATTWKGEVARRVKKELNQMLKGA